MIADLLPPGVAVAEAFDDAAPVRLFDAERAAVADAAAPRRREFATTRSCARRALDQLGMPQAPILPDRGGAPIWPAGIVGSLTHCARYRAAAVARQHDVTALGIDAEPHEALPDGVVRSVAFGAEAVRLEDLRHRDPNRHWDRILFSAKESVYKAWYPLTLRRLGFEDVTLTLDADGSFTARLVTPHAVAEHVRVLAGLVGRWRVENNFVLTAAAS